jgi:hypothetical protein
VVLHWGEICDITTSYEHEAPVVYKFNRRGFKGEMERLLRPAVKRRMLEAWIKCQAQHRRYRFYTSTVSLYTTFLGLLETNATHMRVCYYAGAQECLLRLQRLLHLVVLPLAKPQCIGHVVLMLENCCMQSLVCFHRVVLHDRTSPNLVCHLAYLSFIKPT